MTPATTETEGKLQLPDRPGIDISALASTCLTSENGKTVFVLWAGNSAAIRIEVRPKSQAEPHPKMTIAVAGHVVTAHLPEHQLKLARDAIAALLNARDWMEKTP
jgi:hypothetical protein